MSGACEYCGGDVPDVRLSHEAQAAVMRCLVWGSSTLATAELEDHYSVPADAAERIVEHVLNCVWSWPFDLSAQAMHQQIDAAFGDVPRPPHFLNNPTHCEECVEHEAAFSTWTPRTIPRAALENMGWDPLCFVSTIGMAHYMPALARFAAVPPIWHGYDEIGFRLAWRFSYKNAANEFLLAWTPAQRWAVAGLMDWLQDNAEAIECRCTANDFNSHWQDWSEGATLWRSVAPATASSFRIRK